MYSSQLHTLINRDPLMRKKFMGFCAKDELKPIVLNSSNRNDCAYIANTDNAKEIGEHWVLAYRRWQGNQVLFIDPLANPPDFYGPEFSWWLRNFHVVQLPTPVQGDNSVLCGLFVLYFFYYLSRGCRLASILRTLSKSHPHLNDRLVLDFAWKKFHFNGRKLTGSGGGNVLYKRRGCCEDLVLDYENTKCLIHGK